MKILSVVGPRFFVSTLLLLSLLGASKTAQSDSQALSEDDQEEEEEEHEHTGFFSRLELGFGYTALFGEGVMPPAPGLQRIEDPFHHTPTLSLAFDFGGGLVDNLSLHGGFLLEKPILRYRGKEKMAFNLLGIGLGLTYYFTPYDIFLTARFRYVGAFIFLPDVKCYRYYRDKYEVYGGPGFNITFGKEWFGGDKGGVGLALAFGYYHFAVDRIEFDYLSLLFELTVSRF